MSIAMRMSAYPLAEVIEVTSEGTASIDLMDIPAGTLIEKVLSRTKTAAVHSGAVTFTVGDDDNSAAFLAAADATAAASTIYGDIVAEQGTSMKETVTDSAGTNTHSQPVAGKLYSTAGKEVKFKMNAVPATSEGVYQVMVIGKRYDV